MKSPLRLSALFLLVLLLFGTVACNTSLPPEETPTVEAPTTEAPSSEEASTGEVQEEALSEISLELLKEFKIIRSEHASDEVVAQAIALKNAIKNAYGMTLTLSDDFVREGTDMTEAKYEIIVGPCNRKESEAYEKTLRYHDFGYTLIGNKLLISGGKDEKILEAIDAFVENILKSPSSETVITKEQTLYTPGTYPIENVKLNGIDIVDYRIIFPIGRANLESGGAIIADTVRNATGYRLKIMSDAAEADPTRPEILIGETNRDTSSVAVSDLKDNEVLLSKVGTAVWLTGKDEYQKVRAVREFAKLLEPGANETGVKEVACADSMRLTFDDTLIRTMSFNVKTGIASTSDSRVKLIAQVIATYQPDSVGFQEVSPVWYAALKTVLSEQYDFVGVDRDNNGNSEANPIFYLKDKYELLKSGTEWLSETPTVPGSKVETSKYARIYTYAYLKNKTNGEIFVHVNTHFDHTNDEARVGQAKAINRFFARLSEEGVTFVATGDYNAKKSASSYKKIMESGYVRNSADVTKKGDVNVETYQNWGSSSSIIDHIFISPYVFVEYYKVCDELIGGNYPSDHNALFIDWH